MFKRVLALFSLVMTLTLLLVQGVFAQPSVTSHVAEPPIQQRSSGDQMIGVLLQPTTDITFTPVVSVYLPVIFQNYVACTAVPTLLSPASGATLNTLVPSFRWDNGSAPYVTEFSLDASKDLSFNYTEGFRYSYDIQGIHESHLSWNFEPGTTYYWRAYMSCGEKQGPYSTIWTFTTGSGGSLPAAPNLQAPADGATLAGTAVTLRWSAVTGAVEYNVYLKQSGSYAFYWPETSTESAYSGLDPNSTYEWWITARNAYAWGGESPHRFFTTGPSAR